MSIRNSYPESDWQSCNCLVWKRDSGEKSRANDLNLPKLFQNLKSLSRPGIELGNDMRGKSRTWQHFTAKMVNKESVILCEILDSTLPMYVQKTRRQSAISKGLASALPTRRFCSRGVCGGRNFHCMVSCLSLTTFKVYFVKSLLFHPVSHTHSQLRQTG